MNTKHTQGPWKVADHIYAADGKRVATYAMLSRDDDVNEANARLIAAAPELLDWLNASVEIVERYASNPADCVRRLQALMPQQCAAIAKAGGVA